MSRIDYHIAAAFHRLNGDDLKPVVDFINAERQACLEEMSKLGDETQWRRAQGKAQFAELLLKTVEESSVLMAKLKPAPR